MLSITFYRHSKSEEVRVGIHFIRTECRPLQRGDLLVRSTPLYEPTLPPFY